MLIIGWIYHIIIILLFTMGVRTYIVNGDYMFWLMLAIIAALDGLMNLLFHVFRRKKL